MTNFSPHAWMLPQPVAIIGTYNENDTPNAMNAAWCGQWDNNQIMISMGSHATTDNLKRCPDFTLAFATTDTLPEADYVGLVSGRKHPDKIERTGWKSTKGKNVNAPIFDCFPMTMECQVVQKLFESETECYIIADIINICCQESYLADDGKPDIEKMHLITFDPIHNGYIALGRRCGNAFHDGKN